MAAIVTRSIAINSTIYAPDQLKPTTPLLERDGGVQLSEQLYSETY